LHTFTVAPYFSKEAVIDVGVFFKTNAKSLEMSECSQGFMNNVVSRYGFESRRVLENSGKGFSPSAPKNR